MKLINMHAGRLLGMWFSWSAMSEIPHYGEFFYEAYSVAGEIGFGWWLVEHYLSYHIDCPDGCDSGEPARGRKDPPGFEVGDRSFDHIPDSVDSCVESPLPA